MRAILAALVFVACVATPDAEIDSNVSQKTLHAARRSASLTNNRRDSCSVPHILVRFHRSATMRRGSVTAGPTFSQNHTGAMGKRIADVGVGEVRLEVFG
jgi:hypothetical protein